jgi:hypothetical protein
MSFREIQVDVIMCIISANILLHHKQTMGSEGEMRIPSGRLVEKNGPEVGTWKKKNFEGDFRGADFRFVMMSKAVSLRDCDFHLPFFFGNRNWPFKESHPVRLPHTVWLDLIATIELCSPSNANVSGATPADPGLLKKEGRLIRYFAML